MDPKVTSELYRQAYFESSVTIKTTRIKDENYLLVQAVLAGTLWDKLIKTLSVLSSGIIQSVGLQRQLEQYQPDVSQQAQNSKPAHCHSWLGEQGMWPSFPQWPSALWPLLPTQGQSWQLKIMKTWEGRGEGGRERRDCSYFLFMKWLTFSILTLEHPFVNYLGKKQAMVQESRFQVLFGASHFLFLREAFPFFFHLSQDRTSPLEAAVYFKFQSQGLFIVTPTGPCPFVNLLLDEF